MLLVQQQLLVLRLGHWTGNKTLLTLLNQTLVTLLKLRRAAEAALVVAQRSFWSSEAAVAVRG